MKKNLLPIRRVQQADGKFANLEGFDPTKVGPLGEAVRCLSKKEKAFLFRYIRGGKFTVFLGSKWFPGTKETAIKAARKSRNMTFEFCGLKDGPTMTVVGPLTAGAHEATYRLSAKEVYEMLADQPWPKMP